MRKANIDSALKESTGDNANFITPEVIAAEWLEEEVLGFELSTDRSNSCWGVTVIFYNHASKQYEILHSLSKPFPSGGEALNYVESLKKIASM